jgi:hypothetical protein
MLQDTRCEKCQEVVVGVGVAVCAIPLDRSGISAFMASVDVKASSPRGEGAKEAMSGSGSCCCSCTSSSCLADGHRVREHWLGDLGDTRVLCSGR